MSLRLIGIDPELGARDPGVDRFTAEGSLVNRFPQGQGYADRGGTIGVGPVKALADRFASRVFDTAAKPVLTAPNERAAQASAQPVEAPTPH